jgi:pyruvate dehydrogenase E1 component
MACKRMYVDGEGIFYYISVMNENYAQPACRPAPQAASCAAVIAAHRRQGQAARDAARQRHDPARGAGRRRHPGEEIQGAGRRVLDHQLQRAAPRGLDCERWNLLHPGEEPRVPYVQTLLAEQRAPIVAATDYMRTVPDQIRQWVTGAYVTLGTDGFGRSDARAPLRRHFEVDRNFIALAALKALADADQIDRRTVIDAIGTLGIDPAKPNPFTS